MKGTKEGNYSLFLRRYLLHSGYSSDALSMCRELSAATGYEISYCNHLLQGGGSLTLDEVSALCSKLKVQFEDIFRFAFSSKTVSPAVAKHAYSNLPLEFHISSIPEDVIGECRSFLWLTGLSYSGLVDTVDCFIFDAKHTSQHEVDQLYVTFYNDNYELSLCKKTNAFYSSFQLENNHELVKMRHRRTSSTSALNSSDILIHRIIFSFRTYFVRTPPSLP